MSCGTSKKNPRYKSCVRYYNNSTQALTAGSLLQLQLAGSRVVDTGVSIEVQPSSYTIVTRGLYHISIDVEINTATAGDVYIVAYMDGVELPCTRKQKTVETDHDTLHTETDIEIDSCCCSVAKNITFAIKSVGVAVADVVHVCSGIIKEA